MLAEMMKPGSFKEGIQAAYPLLLSMGQGLSSGQGVGANMGQGLAGMMALQQQNEQKAQEEKLAQAAAGFGMKPVEKALFDSMDFQGQQGYLAQMMQQRQRAAASASAAAAKKAETEREAAIFSGLGRPAPSASGPTIEAANQPVDMVSQIDGRIREAIARGHNKNVIDRLKDLRATYETPERKTAKDASGRLRYLDTGEYAFPDFQEPEEAGFQQASAAEAASYGVGAGQFGPDGRFYPVNPPSGMTVETTPDGGFRMVQGSGAGEKLPKLTVDAAKNTGFAIRMQSSHDILNSLEDQGTDFVQQNLEHAPFGVGNYFRSPDFQRYDQARRDFVNAVLRRESGAVIADSEFENANKQYFPVPGDSPEVIAQKRQNRLNAIRGVEVGAGEGARMIAPNAPDVQAMPYEELRSFIVSGGFQGLPPEMLAIAQDRLEAKQ